MAADPTACTIPPVHQTASPEAAAERLNTRRARRNPEVKRVAEAVKSAGIARFPHVENLRK
jgi:hypothetical protein